jgi:hypothetical protein
MCLFDRISRETDDPFYDHGAGASMVPSTKIYDHNVATAGIVKDVRYIAH